MKHKKIIFLLLLFSIFYSMDKTITKTPTSNSKQEEEAEDTEIKNILNNDILYLKYKAISVYFKNNFSHFIDLLRKIDTTDKIFKDINNEDLSFYQSLETIEYKTCKEQIDLVIKTFFNSLLTEDKRNNKNNKSENIDETSSTFYVDFLKKNFISWLFSDKKTYELLEKKLDISCILDAYSTNNKQQKSEITNSKAEEETNNRNKIIKKFFEDNFEDLWSAIIRENVINKNDKEQYFIKKKEKDDFNSFFKQLIKNTETENFKFYNITEENVKTNNINFLIQTANNWLLGKEDEYELFEKKIIFKSKKDKKKYTFDFSFIPKLTNKYFTPFEISFGLLFGLKFLSHKTNLNAIPYIKNILPVEFFKKRGVRFFAEKVYPSTGKLFLSVVFLHAFTKITQMSYWKNFNKQFDAKKNKE